MQAPKIEDIPDHFFKYRPLGGNAEQLDWLRQTILDDRFFWPAPNQFNDPFDCVPVYIAPTGRELRKFSQRLHKQKEPQATRWERRQFLRRARAVNPVYAGREIQNGMNDALSQSAVYSLAVAPDDVLMWSHYGNAHQGVCLRFDGRGLIRSFVTAYPVVYSNDRPSIRVGIDPALDVLEKLLLTKAEAWRYEQEWRFVEWLGTGPGLRRFHSSLLTGIILGARIVPEDAVEIRQLVAARRRPLALFQAECDEEHFSINLRPLNEAAGPSS